MSTLLQDLQEAGIIITDVEAFESGSQVTAPPVAVGSKTLTVSVRQLPNGPVTPYQTISGNIWQVALIAFGSAEELAAGAPLSLAIKTGDAWEGVTFTLA